MQISAQGGMVAMQQMHQRLFQQADTDQDGALTLDEFKSIGKNMPAGDAKPAGAPSPEDMFAKMDKDGDGKLSTAEMEPPKPRFEASSMYALLEAQSEANEEDETAANGNGAAIDTSGKLEQLLAQLVQKFTNVEQLLKDGATTPASATDTCA